jgi:hypothetical protein
MRLSTWGHQSETRSEPAWVTPAAMWAPSGRCHRACTMRGFWRLGFAAVEARVGRVDGPRVCYMKLGRKRESEPSWGSFLFLLISLFSVFLIHNYFEFKFCGNFIFKFICSIPLNIVWVNFIYLQIYSVLHSIFSLALCTLFPIS